MANSLHVDFIGDEPVTQLPYFCVEILQRNTPMKQEGLHICQMVYSYLKEKKVFERRIKLTAEDGSIGNMVEEITTNRPFYWDDPKIEDIEFFVYSLTVTGAEVDSNNMFCCGGFDNIPASHHWIMPNREFQGQWECLYYEEALKENLLHFSERTMLYAQSKDYRNALSCNKLVLLHGPSGTGKTSLCMALAQKISIHMKNIFPCTHLFQINAQNLLLSKGGFTDSGKLVIKLFAKIKNLAAENPTSLVIILIDEVESIAYARNSMSAPEPSDTLDAVNAVLIQLDQLCAHPNVLVLATTNYSGSIHAGFADRVNLKQHVDFPPVLGVYKILKEAIDKLIKLTIINSNETWNSESMLKLQEAARKAYGLSGRALHKIPLLAHIWFTQNVSLTMFLEAIDRAVDKYIQDDGINYK